MRHERIIFAERGGEFIRSGDHHRFQQTRVGVDEGVMKSRGVDDRGNP